MKTRTLQLGLLATALLGLLSSFVGCEDTASDCALLGTCTDSQGGGGNGGTGGQGGSTGTGGGGG